MALYWFNTEWACGGLEVRASVVVSTAPIFKKFRGQHIENLRRIYGRENVRLVPITYKCRR